MRVLLIDDSRLQRAMLRQMVVNQYPDWEVADAASCNDAREQAGAGAFDFITLDINMPEENGLHFLPELRGLCPDARIAVISANVQSANQAEAREHGAQFISKPVNEEELLRFLAGETA